MRTWSVSGTAFALCTRSSSLSIRTSTSMGSQSTASIGKRALSASFRGYGRLHLLLRADRSAGATAREELLEAPGNRVRNKLVDLAAERGDLFHAARGDEAVLRSRHHVDRLDVRRERSVQVVHLELPFEVRDHAQPLHHRLRAPAAGQKHPPTRED